MDDGERGELAVMEMVPQRELLIAPIDAGAVPDEAATQALLRTKQPRTLPGDCLCLRKRDCGDVDPGRRQLRPLTQRLGILSEGRTQLCSAE